MEKLIELLNEFDSWWDYDDYYWPYQYWQDRDAYKYGKYYLVSRDYWFIKRLKENDKIDFDKCWLDISHYLSYNKRYDKWIVMAKNYDYDTFVVEEFYPPYEQLLMLLAIQDKPIDFLISILK